MLKRLFAWWDTATIGTSFTLWKRGAKLVGEDEQGNRYYEESKSGSHAEGYQRRWVVYHGVAEASRITPDWHGWLHHTFKEPPTVTPLPRQAFEKPYLPNMTGTPLAYRPQGALAYVGEETGADGTAVSSDAATTKDYEAWSPDGA